MANHSKRAMGGSVSSSTAISRADSKGREDDKEHEAGCSTEAMFEAHKGGDDQTLGRSTRAQRWAKSAALFSVMLQSAGIGQNQVCHAGCQ